MSKRAIALFAAVCGAGVLVAGAPAQDRVSPCRGSALVATFAAIPGSAGAGNIVYRLTVRNRSAATCVVSGFPRVTLLGRYGRALPTHVLPVPRGAGTAALISLRPGGRARASARFSPDVPGPGEQTSGRCEPLAYRLRVAAPGGGSAIAPISPPTSVCEHGSLQLSLYGRA